MDEIDWIDKMLTAGFCFVAASGPAGFVIWFGKAYLQVLVKKLDDVASEIKELHEKQEIFENRYHDCQKSNNDVFAKIRDVNRLDKKVCENSMDIARLFERMRFPAESRKPKAVDDV